MRNRNVGCLKWDPDQDCERKTGTEMGVTCGKAAYANVFSNNSVGAALEGERKPVLLIAREQAGGQMGRWVSSMLPFRI